VLYTATAHAITEEMVRLQLMRLLPELSQLLRQAAFVLDYLLVVPRNHEPRAVDRAPTSASGPLAYRHERRARRWAPDAARP